MKVLLLFCTLALGAIAQHGIKADHKDITKTCAEENNVATDDTNKLMKGLIPEPIPQPLKCFLDCKLRKFGVKTADGIDVDKALIILQASPKLVVTADVIKQALNECKDMKGTDMCDQAYQMVKCMMAHNILDLDD